MARVLKSLCFFWCGSFWIFFLVSRMGKIQPDAQILSYGDATFLHHGTNNPTL